MAYTMECYWATKKNEIMPLVLTATWINLEIILGEVRMRKTNTIWYHLYMKSKTWHKWTYLKKRHRLTDMKNRLWFLRERGVREGWTVSLGLSMETIIYKMDKQQGPTVLAQGTIFNILW